MASVAILGGGIAGLTAAYQLQAGIANVTVFEQAGQPGGMIRSERARGYLLEHGPNTLRRATPLMNALISRLDLEDARVPAQPAAKNRYVVRGGTLHVLPTSLPAFLSTHLLSWRARLRLLCEPFVRCPPTGTEETVAQFAHRRLGREVLDYGLNPFVAGVFAGDPERLSLRHAFPRLHALEQEHGSLFGGLIRHVLRRRGNDDPPSRSGLFSFREGLQQLPHALARALGPSVEYETTVTALRPDGAHWAVTTRSGPRTQRRTFDAVVCTLPLHRLGALRWDMPPTLEPLREVPYPPVSLIHLGLRRADVQHPLDGFGMLVPEAETEIRILGTLFSSTLFPNRAPAGHVLLTTFVGGTRHPDLGRADAEAQTRVVREDLQRLLGVQGQPALARRVHWPRAIPQYEVGYGRVKKRLDRIERLHPGLFFAGNYRQGIAVSDAMASADAAAERALHHIGGTAPPTPGRPVGTGGG